MSTPTTLQVKPTSEQARQRYVDHGHFHPGDAGIDLYNGVVSRRGPRQFKIDFEIQTELLRGDRNISYLLVPRSSIVHGPFRMSNSIGVIDAGYRGNLVAFVDVIDGSESEPQTGDRMFQLVTGGLEPIDSVKVVEQLSESRRGTGGFGSTGR